MAENLTYIGGYIASAAALVSKKLVNRGSQPAAQSETVGHSEILSVADPEQYLDAQASANQPQQSPTSNSVAIKKSYIDERFFESFLRAQQNYVPKSYDGQVDFFLSTRNTYVAIAKPYSLASFKHDIAVGLETDLIFGWDEVATNLQEHEFDSRHEDMVSEPYVQRLAQQLNQCLGVE